MKSINVNPVKTLVLSAAIALTSLSVNARTGGKEKATIPVEFSYVGSVNKSPVFQLDLVNDSDEKLYISIRNTAGDVLYSTSFKGKNFSKRIRFDNADLSDLQLKLVVTSKSKTEIQNFQITQHNRVIEEITVGKL